MRGFGLSKFLWQRTLFWSLYLILKLARSRYGCLWVLCGYYTFFVEVIPNYENFTKFTRSPQIQF